MKKMFCFLVILFAVTSVQAQTRWIDPFREGAQTHGVGWSELRSGYVRLPDRAKPSVRHALWDLSRNAAGLSLVFRSNAGEINVRYGIAGAREFLHMPATGVSGVDMYAIDSEGKSRWCAPNPGFQIRDTVLFRYIGLEYFPEGAKEYEYHLYLPLYNTVSWLELGVPDGAKVEFVPESGRRPIVVYGTSIAQGACATRPGMAWTNIVERELRYPVVNLGFSGNGILEPALFELLDQIDAGVYIIDCLPNVRKNIEELVSAGVRKLRLSHDCPILLVEHSGYTNEYTSPGRAYYRESNIELRRTFDKLTAEGVGQLYYLTAEEIGLDMESQVEGVHPNDIGMRKQADAVVAKLRNIMEEIPNPSGID